MPTWNIYKNDNLIGQAMTWYKALYVLTTQENLTHYEVTKIAGFITVWDLNNNGFYYKIEKEG